MKQKKRLIGHSAVLKKTAYSQAKSLLSTLFEDAVAAEAESDDPALSLI